MIVRSFNLRDIKNYEYKTGNNILSFFDDIKFSNIIDLISLGNGLCSEERAAEILDKYLADGGTYVDAVLEIKEALLGVGDNSKNDVEEQDKLDITKYSSLTDLYIEFGMQLESLDFSYSAFWDMTTKEMYKVFNSIMIKLQNKTNRELSNYHTLAAMVGGAVWGKLQKEPPKVDMTTSKTDTVEDMDIEDAILVAKLKSLAGKKGE